MDPVTQSITRGQYVVWTNGIPTPLIALLDSTNIDASYLWYLLVVVWALTVPHMLVTSKIDRKALN